MASTTSTTMPASEAARIAETHATGGKYRSAHAPNDAPSHLGGAGSAGRHAAGDSTEGLVLEAYAAAELIASYCESWTADQVLAHPEIARVAFDEAARTLAPPAKSSSRRRRNKNADDPLAPIRLAASVLADAHSRISFLEA